MFPIRHAKKMILTTLATLTLAATAQAFTPQPGFQLDLKKAPGRFQILAEFDDEAVLDTKTGLIWQRTPDLEASYWWISAHQCLTRETGGQYGWRLPTIEELGTLMDTNNNNRLPWNHPFEVETGEAFWTQTGVPDSPKLAYALQFKGYMPIEFFNKNANLPSWCVRSPDAGSPFYASAD